MAEYISKLWNKKVSVDVIKNIWNGRTKLFEIDFKNNNLS